MCQLSECSKVSVVMTRTISPLESLMGLPASSKDSSAWLHTGHTCSSSFSFSSLFCVDCVVLFHVFCLFCYARHSERNQNAERTGCSDVPCLAEGLKGYPNDLLGPATSSGTCPHDAARYGIKKMKKFRCSIPDQIACTSCRSTGPLNKQETVP